MLESFVRDNTTYTERRYKLFYQMRLLPYTKYGGEL